MSNQHLIVLCSCPTEDIAEQMAQELVEKRLAACVNLVGPVTSFFRWQGAIEKDRELLLLIKTTKTTYDALENYIQEKHPYETPEIIGLQISNGFLPYLEWIERCTDNS